SHVCSSALPVQRNGVQRIVRRHQLVALLLVTDAWARGWRAAPLEGSSQKSYELMPANYALRAVALDRGKHRLRLEYAPRGFRLWAAVSAMAWAAWTVAAIFLWRRERRLARA